MKPGIYKGLSFDKYLAIDAINKSSLDWLDRSPAHMFEACFAKGREVQEPTPAMKLGTAIHSAVLEPKKFKTEYAVGPSVDRRTKEGKNEWQEFLGLSEGKTVLTQDDYDLILQIQKAVKKHDAGSALLSEGSPEVTLVWQDSIDEVLCKARIDWLGSVMLDIKSTLDASPAEFSKQVGNLDWHVQAAFYQDGLKALTGEVTPFVFGALEKAAPYECAFYVLNDESLEVGRKTYRERLARFAECKKTNTWPGYPREITPISLPAWKLKGVTSVITEF